jgi:DNA-binding CsgD family transcriptional regulator
MTVQSENLIRKYFPASSFENNDLPTELKNWLQKSLTNLSIESDFSKPIPSLRIIKDECILMVRLSIDHATDQYLLTLEEQTPLNLSLSALQELHLTKREAEILYWIICDRTNQQISEILNLSNRTVQKHCENIYSKLGVHNRAAAIIKTIQKIGMFIP